MADAIADALESAQFRISIDRRHIPYGEEWKVQIEQFVTESDITVWLVSERSLNSFYCQRELSLAVSSHKKIIPVVIAPIDRAQLPDHLGKRHVLPAEHVFNLEQHFADLVEAINTDIEWQRAHSRLADHAGEWIAGDHAHASLLRGKSLTEATTFLAQQPKAMPLPNPAVIEYIEASRKRRTQVKQWSFVAAATAVVAAFGVYSLFVLEQSRAASERDLKLQSQSFASAQSVERQVTANTDISKAVAEAVAALPDQSRGRRRPYVPNAEAALMRAYVSLALDGVLSGHTDEISHLASSASFRWIASASLDHTARIWSTDGPRLLHTLTAHTDDVLFVLFVATEERVFTASADATIGVWSVRTGALIERLTGHTEPVTQLALSPDGHMLASASTDGTARLWSLEDYSPTKLSHRKPDWEPLKKADGQFVFRSQFSVQGKPHSMLGSKLRAPRYAYVGLGVTGLAWSPDSATIFTTGEDGRIVAWSTTGDLQFDLAVSENPIFALAANLSSSTLIVGTTTLASIWNVQTRRKVADFDIGIIDAEAYNPITQINLSEDGRTAFGFVTSYQHNVKQGIYLWDAINGEFLTRTQPPRYAPVQAMDVGKTPMLLDGVGMVESPVLIRRPPENVVRLTRVGETDQSTSIYEAHTSPVTAVRFSPTPTQFMSGAKDGSIYLWNVADRLIKVQLTVNNAPLAVVKQLDLTDDGEFIVTIDVEGSGKLWHQTASGLAHHELSRRVVFVSDVAQGGPAEQAGLKTGDRIVAIDGNTIGEMQQLQGIVTRNAEL